MNTVINLRVVALVGYTYIISMITVTVVKWVNERTVSLI